MADPRQNVFAGMEAPSKKDCRAAIAKIIRNVQAEHDLDDEDLADAVGCSGPTIGNARKQLALLGADTVAKIGARFGEAAIQPYADLFGGLLTPKAARDTDAVPALAGATHRLSLVQTPKDRLDALPAAYAARDALNHWIAHAEAMAA